MGGDAKEEVVGHFGLVREDRDPSLRVATADNRVRMPFDATLRRRPSGGPRTRRVRAGWGPEVGMTSAI